MKHNKKSKLLWTYLPNSVHAPKLMAKMVAK
jgi:hypothetical protein